MVIRRATRRMRFLARPAMALATGCGLWATPLAAADLTALVEAYFRSPDAKERAKTFDRIKSSQGYSIEALEGAVSKANLWEIPNTRDIHFVLPSGSAHGTEVYVRLPERYSTGRCWPVILLLHGAGGRARDMLGYGARFAAVAGEGFILAAPQSLRGGWFHAPEEEAAEPERLLIELRRRFRVDSDRVYLTGYSMGGHATCLISLMMADRWAGAIPMAGTMVLPHRDLLYPDVLPNLQHLPMLVCWGALDVQSQDGQPSPTGGIAKANRRFVVEAKAAGVPINPVELADVGHIGVVPPEKPLREILSRKRIKYPPKVSHWFRYPGQARAYWLSSRRFRGKPWTGNRLRVKVQMGQEHRAAILDVLRKKLGVLSGRIEGQTVTIQTRHVAEAELLLNDHLVSLDKPVRVILNDREVFYDTLTKRGKVLLETIARDYDFQRLFTARLRLAYRKKTQEE